MNHLDHIDPSTIHLLKGRALIAIDPPAEMVGSLHVPGTAQTRNADTDSVALTGTILAIGYGDFLHTDEGTKKLKLRRGIQPGDVLIGDKVRFRATLDDLDQSRAIVNVLRIDAVLEPSFAEALAGV